MSDKIEYPDASWLPEALLRVHLIRTQTEGAEEGGLNLLEVPPAKQFKHVRVWTYLFHCYLWLTIDGKTGAGNSGPISAIQSCLRARDKLEGIKSEIDQAGSCKVLSERRKKLDELELKFESESAELELTCRSAVADGFPGLESAESFLLLWAGSRRPTKEDNPGKSVGSDLEQILESVAFEAETSRLADVKSRIQHLKSHFDKVEYPDYAFVDHDSQDYQSELAEYDNDPEVPHPVFRRNGQPWSWKTPKEISRFQAETLADELMHAAVMLRMTAQIHPVLARQYLRLSWKGIEAKQQELKCSVNRLYQLENEMDKPLSDTDKTYCKVWVLKELHGLTLPESLDIVAQTKKSKNPSSFNSQLHRGFKQTALAELEKMANRPGSIYSLGLLLRRPTFMLHFASIEQLMETRLDLDS